MTGPYEYRLPGRRPATLFGFGATAALLLVASVGDAPWWIWAGWGGLGLALLWAIVENPVHGCRINETHLAWFRNARETSIPLADISRIELKGWCEGTTSCRILLKNGQLLEPPGMAMPPEATLEKVLTRYGIPVRRT